MSAELEIDALADRLRPHYRRFLEPHADQILLTGHSHQAWPDVTREAQLEAWDDAARLVDKKWSQVFGQLLPDFRARVAARLGSSRPNDLAIGPNTHELVYRLGSCFPNARAVVSSDSEFHSLSRQLGRLAEEGLDWQRVQVADGRDFAQRFLEAVDRCRPDWVAFSLVTFNTGRRIVEAETLLAGLAARALPVLVDAYHAFNVLELHVDRWPGTVFVTGGGYKYAQSGEGACWMLLPTDATSFRPRHTGWFADFAHLESASAQTHYASGGDRFFGATFDPTAFYRARAALRFFDEQGLSTRVLQQAAALRIELLLSEHQRLGLSASLPSASPAEPQARAGFVAFRHPRAAELSAALLSQGVHTDHRGDLLRMGPAPYIGSSELRRAMTCLSQVLA